MSGMLQVVIHELDSSTSIPETDQIKVTGNFSLCVLLLSSNKMKYCLQQVLLQPLQSLAYCKTVTRNSNNSSSVLAFPTVYEVPCHDPYICVISNSGLIKDTQTIRDLNSSPFVSSILPHFYSIKCLLPITQSLFLFINSPPVLNSSLPLTLPINIVFSPVLCLFCSLEIPPSHWLTALLPPPSPLEHICSTLDSHWVALKEAKT